MPELEERRTHRPTPQLAWTLVLALIPLAGALYYLFVPWVLQASNGYIRCGSVLRPPSDKFSENVCNDVRDVNVVRFWTLLALGLAMIALGAVVHGVRTTTETRQRAYPPRLPDPYEDDWEDRSRAPRASRPGPVDDSSERSESALEDARDVSHAWVESGPEARARSRRRLPWHRDDDIDLSVDRDPDPDPEQEHRPRGRRARVEDETERGRSDDDWTV